ncbi:N5-carboxyaminoimidazole ribonucleotide mutase [Campylobacterota bacterium]|nr:N5-carboxyaminoimidazole ribonucleotide mutase [Campylobacterota bacterium]
MKPFVAVILGSKSDFAVMQAAVSVLENFGVAHELIVASAHRTPERVSAYVSDAVARGAQVFVAAAGMAAHLAGAIAAQTTKPVIGVPIASGSLGGFDALLSTVQMPPKMPVATVAVGGAANAAYLALQILSLGDSVLAQKLLDDRAQIKQQVENDSKTIEILLSRSA